MNFARTLEHEVFHKFYPKLDDHLGVEGEVTSGPIVDFVNHYREQMNLPTRTNYLKREGFTIKNGQSYSIEFQFSDGTKAKVIINPNNKDKK